LGPPLQMKAVLLVALSLVALCGMSPMLPLPSSDFRRGSHRLVSSSHTFPTLLLCCYPSSACARTTSAADEPRFQQMETSTLKPAAVLSGSDYAAFKHEEADKAIRSLHLDGEQESVLDLEIPHVNVDEINALTAPAGGAESFVEVAEEEEAVAADEEEAEEADEEEEEAEEEEEEASFLEVAEEEEDEDEAEEEEEESADAEDTMEEGVQTLRRCSFLSFPLDVTFSSLSFCAAVDALDASIESDIDAVFLELNGKPKACAPPDLT
jgi:hypothetical protein